MASSTELNGRNRRLLQQLFETSLAGAASQRNIISVTVVAGVFERETMLHTVNCVRRLRGRPDVQMSDIERCDQLATGHSDWCTKFPLYCVELALEEM